ncbi:MAG: PIN domain nuclease [Ilumatobacteraceae bacterium]|nr:PIN domain nuclease [Ilumatobacteraceae bacterium]
MILVDSSAWIEFLRDTGSPVCDAVDRLLDADLATCDVVVMEVLAGAHDERHLAQLRSLLGRTTLLPTTSADYELAASLYRACRVRGATVRRLTDCLIAAVAISADAHILHADADFVVLGEHTEVQIHPDSSG